MLSWIAVGKDVTDVNIHWRNTRERSWTEFAVHMIREGQVGLEELRTSIVIEVVTMSGAICCPSAPSGNTKQSTRNKLQEAHTTPFPLDSKGRC
ncbi:hypothetical protein FOPE_12692 [Fonsecaea pedrosoi]|nr:hypothetical protein FOPE_12692 [Fonsecaea pedrosoi]